MPANSVRVVSTDPHAAAANDAAYLFPEKCRERWKQWPNSLFRDLEIPGFEKINTVVLQPEGPALCAL